MSAPRPPAGRRGTCFCLAHARAPPEGLLGDDDAAEAEARLRAELGAMRVKALKVRANQAGVIEASLEEADDADDIKQAVIDLVVAAESSGGGDSDRMAELRRQLVELKLGALRKRARELGVNDADLDDADDADDAGAIKAAIIALCLEAADDTGGAVGEAAAVELIVAARATLTAELQGSAHTQSPPCFPQRAFQEGF